VSPCLSIVIVHYNTPEDLGRCLESLRAQAPACEHEVVVIDNASTAPGLDELQDRFDQVRWVRNAENVGYGRACNQGMALVPADYHLILNPDIVVLEGAIDAALRHAERHPRAGIIGPQLLNEDGTIQESCRRFYTFWTLLMRRTLLGKLVPNSRTVARHLMRDFDHQSVRPVDWVLGGCLLVRREALARCGPMDDRFFLYFEDVDWCYRMWQCGYEVVYLPDARFVHRHRRSSARGALDRSFWLHLTSLISFYEKWSLVVYMAKKWRRPVEVSLHWLLDMVLLAVALLGAYGLRWLAGPLFSEELLRLGWYVGWAGWAGLVVTVAFAMMGRYGGPSLRRGLDWGSHLKQMGMVALLLLAGSYLGRDQVVSRAVLVAFLALYTVLSAWALHLVHGLHRRLTHGYLNLERTLLVGAPAPLTDWLGSVTDPRALGVDVVGYVCEARADRSEQALGGGEVPWLGSPDALDDLVERFRVSQVAFWQRPGDDPRLWSTLSRLRRRRIRLRWILDEAWLLSVGARAEGFGASPSGVLDPDDRLALRRGLRRPLEVVVGGILVVAAGLLAPWRRWRHRQGRATAVAIDTGTGHDDHDPITVATDSTDHPLPIWWQLSLAIALIKGRIGLTGAPLRRDDATVDPSRYLIDLEAARPGLTGRWAGTGARADGFVSRWRTFFMNPGGWGRPASPAAPTTPRPDGEEVHRS
jgi:GT2 family glycosyltransferase